MHGFEKNFMLDGINNKQRAQWYYLLENTESTAQKMRGNTVVFIATLITIPQHDFMRKVIKLGATALSFSLAHF